MAELSERFERALVLAHRLHQKQTRKGTATPYLSHLLAVAGLVLENGGDEDTACAAVLHDAIEDQGGESARAQIRAACGGRVATIVDEVSDTDEVPKPPWRARKAAYIARVPELSAAALLVSLADKLHNLRTLIEDQQRIGEAVWSRFTGGREGTLWYYRELGAAFERRPEHRPLASCLASETRVLETRLRAVPSQPIVILGFGRSGTTWVSDVLSKALGRLLLFEPLHPTVTEHSRELAYRADLDAAAEDRLRALMTSVLSGRERKPWLLRNHVPFPLAEMSEAGMDEIWNQCAIGGVKLIRGNFLGAWFRRELSARVLHVVRHPAAVASSILRRKNFWEFGWPETFELYRDRVRALPILDPSGRRQRLDGAASDLERIAVMWSVAVAAQLDDAKVSGAPVLAYEHLYADPFAEGRALLDALGEPNARLHPSHLFTPAMTTLRTVHGLKAQDGDPARGAAQFWQGTLDHEQVQAVLRIAAEFGLEGWDERGGCRLRRIGVRPPE